MANEADRAQAAEALRKLLLAVKKGEMTADSPQDRRLLRRVEGAVAAFGADVSRRRRGRLSEP